MNYIEFVNQPICKVYDIYGQKICHQGMYLINWDKNHNCRYGKIIIENPNLLIHELGHIYELCELKRDVTTEKFADNFRII